MGWAMIRYLADGRVRLPVAILAHYASDGELPWLAGQTYLEPFPAALRLRHNVPR